MAGLPARRRAQTPPDQTSAVLVERSDSRRHAAQRLGKQRVIGGKVQANETGRAKLVAVGQSDTVLLEPASEPPTSNNSICLSPENRL